MQHLIIRNIGPIDSVSIELNKINIIMGPQSSGKSTIIKIACFCHWVEKKVSMNRSFDFFSERRFEESLVQFHKLEGYIKNNSYIEYESDIIKFVFDKSKTDTPISFDWKEQDAYKHNKISYIPAERNLVAAIPNWLEVRFQDNNILNFMVDWGNARKAHTETHGLEIPSLDASYYFDTEKETDYIRTKENIALKFTNASSGLQSVVPLMVLVKYFTEWIYKNNEAKSVNEIAHSKFIEKELYNKYGGDGIKASTLSKNQQIDFETRLNLMTRLQYSNLFIEEPESNLFPTTQRDLLYYMMRAVNSENNHHLFLTTHSPYILNALNNCMTGFLVKDSMPTETMNQLASHESWISPKEVSVWQIKDGKLTDIKTSRIGTIGEHYFNDSMNEILDEYYVMLKYIKRS